MHAGIIRAFKAHYQQYLVRSFLKCVEDGKLQVLNLRQALRFVKQAWGEVTCVTIRNCYRHVNILPSSETEAQDDEDDDMPLSELLELLNAYNESGADNDQSSASTAEQYVDVDSQEETGQSLSNDDILDIVCDSKDADNPSDDDDNEPAPVPAPSAKEAKTNIESLVRYFETMGDEKNLELVLRMQNSFAPNCSIRQQAITKYFVNH
ncbi:uncharacterized protein LOC121387256 [Gigantopelta aegis]|uniref:uncharacterized protein LOC121387256 n=1 Tax=Gigantopelta aegis TaxID=1735272 RepID=UPI001B88D795|nr:uncharacterized protein LOC121387256 [Gigantopelta aegis]